MEKADYKNWVPLILVVGSVTGAVLVGVLWWIFGIKTVFASTVVNKILFVILGIAFWGCVIFALWSIIARCAFSYTGKKKLAKKIVEGTAKYVVLPEGGTGLDVGCGSGILGISAVKLGAAKAYLTDVDPIAVKSANHNAALNGVAEKCVVAHADLLEDTSVQGDVMLANITGEILVRLAPSIPKNLKRDGVLILSGIIESRLQMVKDAFSAEGLHVIKQRQKGDWYALALRFNEAGNGERTGV